MLCCKVAWRYWVLCGFVWLRSSGGVLHIKIVCHNGSYILGQFSQPFDSVPTMVQFFSQGKLPIRGTEQICLVYPVLCSKQWYDVCMSSLVDSSVVRFTFFLPGPLPILTFDDWWGYAVVLISLSVSLFCLCAMDGFGQNFHHHHGVARPS